MLAASLRTAKIGFEGVCEFIPHNMQTRKAFLIQDIKEMIEVSTSVIIGF